MRPTIAVSVPIARNNAGRRGRADVDLAAASLDDGEVEVFDDLRVVVAGHERGEERDEVDDGAEEDDAVGLAAFWACR